MNSGISVVPAELVADWQAAYREYLSVAQAPMTTWVQRAEMARLCAGVAAAWRDMTATPGLAWWLVAALTTAAEAYENQARDFGMPPGRPTERGGGPRRREPGEGWSGSGSGDLGSRG